MNGGAWLCGMHTEGAGRSNEALFSFVLLFARIILEIKIFRALTHQSVISHQREDA